MGENESRPKSPQNSKRIRIVGCVLEAAILAALIFYALKTWSYMVPGYTICMIICALAFLVCAFALIRTKSDSYLKTMLLISGILLCLAFFVNSFSIPFSSTDKKNYSKQYDYLTRERYMPQFFPNSIPESATQYRLDFCSEDFRSSSYVMLEFSCEETDMSPFAKQAKSKAVLSPMSIEEAKAADLVEKFKAEIAGFIGVEIDMTSPVQLQICFPDDLDEHPNAKVYILRCSNNIADLTTEAIILDENDNWICFSTII